MHRHGLCVVLVTLVVALATSCRGASNRSADGSWYGTLSVDVPHRTVRVSPTCKLSGGRWVSVAQKRAATVLRVSRRADIEIYYKPSGNAAEGHGQPADLNQLAESAMHDGPIDSPPRWFVTVHGQRAVSIVEDSGVRSSGRADRRTFACVWARDADRDTRVYVPGVFGPNEYGLEYRPRTIIYTGDGSSYVNHSRYRSYGGPRANAVGIEQVDDCRPSCAAGTYHPVPARVTLWRLGKCRGKRIYTMFEIDAPGARRYGLTNPFKADLRFMAECPAT